MTARLLIAIPVLEQLLHLQEHGIQIVGGGIRSGHLLELELEGDGLPEGPVHAIMRNVDGRTVLDRLEPTPEPRT